MAAQGAKGDRKSLYTYQVDIFGRVILRGDRQRFDEAVAKFTKIVEDYHAAVKEALKAHRDELCKSFVDEFLPRWREQPPDYIVRWGSRDDEDGLCRELENRANEVFDEMLDFDPPSVRVVEKNVSPKNVEDPQFTHKLKAIMEKRRVPKEVIDTLFETGGAAPEQRELFKKRSPGRSS